MEKNLCLYQKNRDEGQTGQNEMLSASFERTLWEMIPETEVNEYE